MYFNINNIRIEIVMATKYHVLNVCAKKCKRLWGKPLNNILLLLFWLHIYHGTFYHGEQTECSFLPNCQFSFTFLSCNNGYQYMEYQCGLISFFIIMHISFSFNWRTHHHICELIVIIHYKIIKAYGEFEINSLINKIKEKKKKREKKRKKNS